MRFVSAAEIENVLDYPGLIAVLDEAFRAAITVPVRHHHAVARPGGEEAALILMPAWQDGAGHIGVKIVTVFPDNQSRARPSVIGSYLLLAGDSGEPLAMLDGVTLTLWRTAAASALAARYLARKEARRLTVIGAGALAPRLIAARGSGRARISTSSAPIRRACARRMTRRSAPRGFMSTRAPAR
jgi:ornithine cyclodeaminase